MLLDGLNPYRMGLPEVLRLAWDDFEFAISPANRRAIGQTAEWAVFGYLAADCNLAADMFDDLMEMKAVGSSDTIHMMALFDGPLLTDSFIARFNPGASLNEDVILRFNELRTSDAATLTMALRVASAYPARHRLLLLGGHGSGWRGVLLDENLGMHYRRDPGRLVLPGAGAACDARLQDCQRRAQDLLNQQLTKPGATATHCDVLALDACYMGNIEAIAHLASLADLLVVSEDLMPGEGFAYRDILTQLARNPSQSPTQVATSVVDLTSRFYRAAAPPRHVTLAALAADRLAPFADAFMRLVQELDPPSDDSDAFATIRYGLEKAWSFGHTGTIDLKGFVEKLLENPLPTAAKNAAATVLDRFTELVVTFAGGGTSDTTNGLSVYAPAPAKFDMAYLQSSNALPLNFGIWAWFLGGYYLQRLGVEAPSHPLIQAFQATMQDLVARGVYTPASAPAAR